MKTRFILLSIIILLCSCEKGEVIAPDNISGNLYKIYSKRYQKIDGDWERIPNEGSLPYNASIHWLIKEDGVCRYVYFPLTAEDYGDIALYDTEYDSYYFQPDYKKLIVKTTYCTEQHSGKECPHIAVATKIDALLAPRNREQIERQNSDQDSRPLPQI